MKYFTLLFTLFIALNTNAQSLKGRTLGKPYYGNNFNQTETVSGIPGNISIKKTLDGLVYEITFSFKNNDFQSLKDLVRNIESNYNIRLGKIGKADRYRIHYDYSYEIDEFNYKSIGLYSDSYNKEVSFSLISKNWDGYREFEIRNIRLSSLNDEQQKKSKTRDF
ncbi:hypothetical protein [uncultured Lutibacter sp.]|uniref:hypothetical protein n=1 Tax=uncultured Lutibacter sp. TaxID=437739 RepID=UPI00260C1E8B|nr:hypothetical protein [uncultured Lutibacter sp.]